MKLIIEDDEGRKTVVPFARDEITIGRQEGNTIRLTERNVSRRHARLFRDNGAITLEDLGSSFGVRVNGDRVNGRRPVKEGDLIEIGDYDLSLEGAPSAQDDDTNPTQQASLSEKTPPMASPAPRPAAPPPTAPASVPAPAPRAAVPAPAPSRPAPQPAPQRAAPDANSTAVIRLTDIPGMDEAQARELGPNEAPRLVGLAGALRGRDMPLRKTVVKFGRIPDGNDLVIDHPSISRSHGRFQFEGGQWRVYDNKSANGIRVNGEEYGMSPVRPGDSLELGHVKFRFCAPGEAFTPPREVAPSRPADDDFRAPKKSKMPVAIGAVAAVVVLGAAGAYFAFNKKENAADTAGAEVCSKGRSAFINERWAEAVKQLTLARELRVDCGDVEAMLAKSKLEAEAKGSLDEAELLLAEGKFRQALNLLKEVPAESAYGAEARLRTSEARTRAVNELADLAQKDLERGRLEDARASIDDIEGLSPDSAVLPMLRSKLGAASSRAAARPSPPSPVPTPSAPAAEKTQTAAAPVEPARPAPPSAPPQPTLDERNAAARAKIQQANQLIKSDDYKGAVRLLNEALGHKPGTAFVAAAYRSLGVSYARLGQMDDAAKYYELYLKAKPDASDRKQLEDMLKRYYESKGG